MNDLEGLTDSGLSEVDFRLNKIELRLNALEARMIAIEKGIEDIILFLGAKQ